MTLAGAVGLLLVSTLLFLGVWALLPDRTGETHSYDAPSFSAGAESTELYPWNLMTIPWEDAAGSLDEDELFDMLNPLLGPQLSPPTLHIAPFVTYWREGEFLCDETKTLVGFRDVEIWVRSYTGVLVNQFGEEEIISETDSVLPYRFSLALRGRAYGPGEVCFLSLEPPPREKELPAAEKAGLAALTEWVEKRDLNLENGSPFAAFLWRFTDFCAMLDCDYESYNAALLLFETGVCEVNSEDHTVCFTFTGKEGEMTLLCDPVYQMVYGISLRNGN